MGILRKLKICLLLVFILKTQESKSEHILFFHHIVTYSHRVVTWPLAEALSNRGHNVTYISPFYPKEPNPNITEVVPQKMAEHVDNVLNQEFDISIRVRDGVGSILDFAFEFGYDTCEALFTSIEFKDWLKTVPKVDLLFADNCLPDCGIGLAHKLGAKYIQFDSVAPWPNEYDSLGFLPESSAIPELEIKSPPVPMPFMTRVSNTLLSLRYRFWHYLYSIRIHKLIQESLNVPDMPFIGDLVRNVSLVFHTGDYFTDYARSFPPNVVNIAGIHCKESTKDLPKSVKDFIENDNTNSSKIITNDGFVYISMGSLVKPANLPQNIKQVFFDTIKSLPNVRFLWKWDGTYPKNIPENLYLSKWFPQQDVLAHPKIRLFVTQGGRPSTLEAIFNGVPMVILPVLGDQDLNSNRLASLGAATKFEIGEIVVDTFKRAIENAVYDSSTKERLKQMQKLFKDRQNSPLDTAVWWTEFVLRHPNMYHLKPSGSEQYWFVRRQLDVWMFLSFGIFMAIGIITVIVVKLIQQSQTGNPKYKQM